MTTTPEPPSPPASDHDLWHGGWLRGVRHAPSPNFGPRPPAGDMQQPAHAGVSLVVVHSISLPPGQYGGPEVEQLFTNQLDWDAHPYFQAIRGLEVSAHFFIRRTGEVVQFVSCDARAWHAGQSSFGGRANCNDYAIGIELEGLEGSIFESGQYQSLTVLIETIMGRYPIEAITGHEHVAPGRKTDPGPGFDWERLRQGLAHRALAFPSHGPFTGGANSETT